MQDSIRHRGPDDQGVYTDGPVALGHRRLSIIDLSPNARQPMSNPEETIWITYNGEIYNFPSLRDELSGLGYAFKSRSDTEVLVLGYQHWGLQGLLKRLNGIFSFAIWDSGKRQLLAARDHLGVKPFYFVHSGRFFMFASEIKALLRAGHPFVLNVDALEEQIVFRFVAGERTLIQGVRRLLPGSYLEFDDHSLQSGSYWSPLQSYVSSDKPSSPKAVEDTLRDAVAMQLISDVPVGVLCSGGLDSSIITALAAGHINDLNTFCVSFCENGYDDSPYARMVSAQYRTRHHEMFLDADQFVQQLMEAVWANDEPLAHGHEAQLLNIARLAKPHVTVLLSGEGADELFGGYGRYELVRFSKLIRCLEIPLVRKLVRPLLGHETRRIDKLFAFADFTPSQAIMFNSIAVFRSHLQKLNWTIKEHYPYRSQVVEGVFQSGATGMAAAMMYDQMIFLSSLLDRNDKMTMHASIECRVPFLDYRLVQLANRLSGHWRGSRERGKRVLRKRLGPLLPKPVLQRKKLGFGVPLDMWFRKSQQMQALLWGLLRGEFVHLGFWEQGALKILIEEYLSGAQQLGGMLWNLLALELWYVETKRHLSPRPEGSHL